MSTKSIQLQEHTTDEAKSLKGKLQQEELERRTRGWHNLCDWLSLLERFDSNFPFPRAPFVFPWPFLRGAYRAIDLVARPTATSSITASMNKGISSADPFSLNQMIKSLRFFPSPCKIERENEEISRWWDLAACLRLVWAVSSSCSDLWPEPVSKAARSSFSCLDSCNRGHQKVNHPISLAGSRILLSQIESGTAIKDRGDKAGTWIESSVISGKPIKRTEEEERGAKNIAEERQGIRRERRSPKEDSKRAVSWSISLRKIISSELVVLALSADLFFISCREEPCSRLVNVWQRKGKKKSFKLDFPFSIYQSTITPKKDCKKKQESYFHSAHSIFQ